MALVGGVEAGGTKFVCAIGTGPSDIRAERTIPTGSPERTLPAVIEFFRDQPEPVTAVGVGSFGPLDLDPASRRCGEIGASPKRGWRGVNIGREIERGLNLPVATTTDVIAAALGEARWGGGRDRASLAYITVGTGIGAGILVNGAAFPGHAHGEFGHIPVPHDLETDPFLGICPAHGACLEGLASGPAMRARWGTPPEELPPDHPGWALESRYLAVAILTLIYTLMPDRILVGGGVMRRSGLMASVRRDVAVAINGYVDPAGHGRSMEALVGAPRLGGHAGVLGAMSLALALP